MQAINWLLINAGDAVLWLWAGVKAVFGWLFGSLDAVLNPVLSPALAVVNPICTAIGDALYAALRPLPVWIGLTLLSAVTGVVMLVAFRYTSNQDAIGRAKDDIKAQLLALKLYKDELRVTFHAQFRLLWAILRLQRYVLTPVLWMAVPMLLGLAQMGLRYQWRPLHVGERTQIRMDVEPEAIRIANVTLLPNPGVVVEVGPVPGTDSLVWRVRAGELGRHTIRFQVDHTTLEKELVVSDAFERVGAMLPGSRWTQQLLHPAEPPVPSNSPVRSIEIVYPHVESWIYGADYWIVYFLVISMITALIFKPLFKVRF